MGGTRFNIDFFEFSFLVEACIPPRPIARTCFWKDVINVHYHKMTPEERAKLFEWIPRNGNFDTEKELCQLFYDRFNPDNQYKITTVYEGKTETQDAFLHKGKYHTSDIRSIIEEYITDIEKIEWEEH